MKKEIFGLMVILLMISSVGAFAQTEIPSDFIGTWTLKVKENREIIESNLIFNVDTWTFIAPGQNITAEIVSCQIITNEDKNSKKDFPNGILLSIRQVQTGNIVSIRIFQHRNKQMVILPDFFGFDKKFAYSKQ